MKKKTSAPATAAAMASGYSRIIPLTLNNAYVSTADGRTLHCKVGSLAFFTAVATLFASPAAAATAAHCAELALRSPDLADAWNAARSLLLADDDGAPLATIEALTASLEEAAGLVPA